MCLIGWSLGEAYIVYAERISNIGNFIILLFGIFILVFIAYFLLKKIRNKVFL